MSDVDRKLALERYKPCRGLAVFDQQEVVDTLLQLKKGQPI
jgi:hypothetical protein